MSFVSLDTASPKSPPVSSSTRATPPSRTSFSVFSRIDGKRYRVMVKESDMRTLRMEKIKRNLARATGIPVEEQVLASDGKVLKDDMTGGDIKLSEKSTLILLSRHKTLPRSDFESLVTPRKDKEKKSIAKYSPERRRQPKASPKKKETMRDWGSSDNSTVHESDKHDTSENGEVFPFHSTKISSHSFSQSNESKVHDLPHHRLQQSTNERARSPLISQRYDTPQFSLANSPMRSWSADMSRSSSPAFEFHRHRILSDGNRGDTVGATEDDEPYFNNEKHENVTPGSPARTQPQEPGWEQEKESLKRFFERQAINRLEEEKLRWNRSWSMEKKELLQRANRDRQELMQENSRLRREMFVGYSSIDNKQLEDERDVLMKRINKLDSEKQNLMNQLAHAEAQYETACNKSDSETQAMLDEYRQEVSALHERNDQLMEDMQQLEDDLERERQANAENINTAGSSKSQLEEIRSQAKEQWESEKRRMLKNWKEETDILTYLSQEAKEKWDKEKEELLERFERERTLHRTDGDKKIDSLNQEVGTLRSEVAQLQSINASLSSEYDLVIKKISDYMLYVESTDSAIAELNTQIKRLTKGDTDAANALTQMATQKAMESKRVERLEKENVLLRERFTDENRKRKVLHNEMEGMKGNIRVVVRMRPLLKREVPSDISGAGKVECRDENTVAVTTTSNGTKLYDFFQVLNGESTQEAVFDEVRPLIQSAIDGYNVCILAYGQTGTGKTFTIYGDPSKGLQGILPRAVEELIVQLDKNNYIAKSLDNLGKPLSDMATFQIKCSMMELYLDNVIDLLDEKNGHSSTKSKHDIRQHKNGNIYVQGLSEHAVQSHKELMQALVRGNDLRQVHKTSLNNRSSRSHTIFTINLQTTSRVGKKAILTNSKLIFVDLAGSERVNKSHSQGDRFKEAQHINKSLSALGDVISSLSLKKSHVPYRNSKLTMLLHDSVGGNAKTIMFANISPGMDSVTETVSTLSFAARVRKVQNKALKNEDKK